VKIFLSNEQDELYLKQRMKDSLIATDADLCWVTRPSLVWFYLSGQYIRFLKGCQKSYPGYRS